MIACMPHHFPIRKSSENAFMCLLQVAWSRYLVSFQMELADKKCRPSGSPPRDSGFLNLHLRICAFPTHDSGCKFADYFQRCAIAQLQALMWLPGLQMKVI